MTLTIMETRRAAYKSVGFHVIVFLDAFAIVCARRPDAGV